MFNMSEKNAAKVPPRWFVRTAWMVHKSLYRITAGKFGLRKAQPDKWGMMHLTSIGRKSGLKRTVILAYAHDGPNLVTLAMNGWADADPAWWLNLQANPEATVVLPGGGREVRARKAEGAERQRLWANWEKSDEDLDRYAALRSSETAVVVLEPMS